MVGRTLKLTKRYKLGTSPITSFLLSICSMLCASVARVLARANNSPFSSLCWPGAGGENLLTWCEDGERQRRHVRGAGREERTPRRARHRVLWKCQ